jgi:putative toxin-antitoxin system antitoxin component (TIGR02293 family)
MVTTNRVRSQAKTARTTPGKAGKLVAKTTASGQLVRLIASDDQSLERMTRAGIGSEVVVHLAEKLQYPPARFGTFIGLSRATLDRKLKAHSVLGLVESDRVVRYTQLWKQALHLWGSEDAARQWLTAPEQSLGGVAPIEHAMTEIGSRQVEDLMGQIAHGITP